MAKKSVVGLDIGSSSLKAVQMTLKGGEPYIEKVGAVELAPDMIVDGNITSPEILATVIAKLWRESKFSTKTVVANLNGSHTVARTHEFDWHRDEDFRKIFHMKLEDVFPISLEDYQFDFHTLQEYAKRERDPNDAEAWILNPKKFVLLVGAKKDGIDDIIKATQSAKLQPIAININGLALLTASRTDVSAEDAADVSIDIGADTITVVVHKFGQPIYIRNVSNVGGRLITQAITEEFQIPYEKAENRKLEALSVGNTPTVSADHFEDSVFSFTEEEKQELVQDLPPQIERSREIISEHMSNIISTVRDTIETFLYSQTGVDLETFSPFVLSGGVALTPGLAERLASEFKNGVTLATPFSSSASASIPEELLEKEHEFAIAKGLAAGWIKENG